MSELLVLVSWLASDDAVGAIFEDRGTIFGCEEGKVEYSARLFSAEWVESAGNGAGDVFVDIDGLDDACESPSPISDAAFLESSHLISASCAFTFPSSAACCLQSSRQSPAEAAISGGSSERSPRNSKFADAGVGHLKRVNVRVNPRASNLGVTSSQKS
jgi:hypothetical protein